MNENLVLSLCIPTNGVTEWVIPVLNSIYNQNCNNEFFEVIVTDNGNNNDFYDAMMTFKDKYNNFIYDKTDAKMFLNQIEAFKLANGQMIKFINHRMVLLPGALDYLINFAKENNEIQPVVYFSNGMLSLNEEKAKCDSFDAFVKTLSYWSSWSAGTTMWKKDFEKMDLDSEFNTLFPHTDMIFFNRNSSEYIVDNTVILDELKTDNTRKGNYDLFNAFCVEYPSVIKRLYDNGDISLKTFKYILKENKKFVSKLYFDYVVLKAPCSYDLKGYKKSVGKYYNDIDIKIRTCVLLVDKIHKKITKI